MTKLSKIIKTLTTAPAELAFRFAMFCLNRGYRVGVRYEHVWRWLPFSRTPKLFESPDNLVLLARPAYIGDLIAVFGREEEGEIGALLKAIPAGGVCVDVGAHIGGFALRAARQVGPKGKVIAFEPIPGNCRLLEKNAELNQFHNISINETAASGQTHRIILYTNQADSTWASSKLDWAASLNRRALRSNLIETEVETTTLDLALGAYNLYNISVLKIDTEGAEVDVISGATGLLASRTIDVVIIEVHAESNWAPLQRYFENAGYSHSRAFGNFLLARRPVATGR